MKYAQQLLIFTCYRNAPFILLQAHFMFSTTVCALVTNNNKRTAYTGVKVIYDVPIRKKSHADKLFQVANFKMFNESRAWEHCKLTTRNQIKKCWISSRTHTSFNFLVTSIQLYTYIPLRVFSNCNYVCNKHRATNNFSTRWKVQLDHIYVCRNESIIKFFSKIDYQFYGSCVTEQLKAEQSCDNNKQPKGFME